ncbi:lipopolysaccharide kinase InaA family protein [Salinisphaera sp.]|uniref:lipopolysaccharide kinase InaA family protein n=1 Tax=Salinisphaera sp. TaxID=1914330 RepID=UPI000C6945AD|nr:lipopolysaccharide kinase InaA family protein [Salinisphaera sp.]MBS61979.1 hypothetical protein [Salinisphaera sp.]
MGPATGLWRLHGDPALRIPPAHAWQPFKQGPHSALFRLDAAQPILAKLAYPRSQPRDSLRKYVNAQARREYLSAHRLQAAGLTTPSVHGWGVSLSPFAAYECVLFMAEVPDYHSSLVFIRESDDDTARRRLLDRLASDMARLHGHGLIHKDGHFDNIGWIGQQSLVWIDNDIRCAQRPAALRAGFCHMQRMLRRTARDAIHSSEWHYFNDCLRRELARWPKARILIDEV